MNFPILTISTNNVIVSYLSLDDLTICNVKGYKSGYYDSLTVFDSNCNEYKLKNALIEDYLGSLWGYNIFLERKARVAFDSCLIAKKIPFLTIKDRVSSTIRERPELWQSSCEINDLIFEISKTKDIPELARLLI